ncbi:MAG TPA: GAP family protein [Solirubrobacterales bacterium]|nr:GAP family protein [Solirubrobacterales bacterium]
MAQIIPLAVVMVAGPQILSAIFLATSENWGRNAAAYVLGSAISISLIVAAAFLLGGGASDAGTSDDTIYIIVLVLLLAAALYVFLNRKKVTEPPKWMGKLQTASAGFSFRLGFLLLGFFPTDILTSVAVGGYIASQDDPLWYYLPFLGVTLLFLALPSLLIVAMGDRAKAFLPKVRDWMNDNSWIVNEFVIVLFIGMTLGNIV